MGKQIPQKESIDADGGEDTKEALSEVFKEGKYGAWIWFEDSLNGPTIWNSIGALQHGADITRKFRLVGCKNLFLGDNLELKSKSAEYTSKQFQEISKWNKKGHWISTEEVCGLANKRKWSVNEDQRKNLKLFCAKPKSEE